MKKIKSSLISFSALTILSTACIQVEGVISPSKKESSNRVTNTKDANQIIGDSEVQLQVMSESVFKQVALKKSILSLANPKTLANLKSLPQGKAATSISKELSFDSVFQEESLLIGFPIGLIGEQSIFGGVITKVTDKDSDLLGTLKLTDLSPIHVRTVISNDGEGNVALTLVGCTDKCEEESQQVGLISFPIVGFNEDTGMVMVDMAAIGKELDLISMLDPKGEYTKLKAVSSDTTTVEYDMKTLIFDIKTKMIPVTATANDPAVKTTDFTVRWYLKLGSGFNPAFKPRSATEGVGFFKTKRNTESKITRFSTTGNGTSVTPVKYFIKNVPDQYKKSFSNALDSWNVEFKKIIGKELIGYEFVDQTDSRSETLVPGDIRYNIIEWDLQNKASYGGLGPSIANQHSGETMSANVLVQGPTIVRLYTQWFLVSGKVTRLLAEGKKKEANQLIKSFETQVSKEMEALKPPTFKIKVGPHLEMTVQSQRADLEDPIIRKEFEIVPAGMTYEKYMEGYMVEIVAHEIGHNLGLRHNFKGNLGAYENNADPGSVSRSVMEYLGRPYRHLNTIGPYDRMAIAYGYKGVTPAHKTWFCTDEDQATDPKSLLTASPECTKSDATSDPFSFWEGRLARIINLVVETESFSAPTWSVKDVDSHLSDTVTGLAAYALSAEATAHTWTNFFGKSDRPENKSEITGYVLQKIKAKVCDPELTIIIASKESAEAQKVAQDNLDTLIKTIARKAAALGWSIEKELNCTK